MKVFTTSLALALGFVPLVAYAQGDPGGGPPPEVRAKMQQARSDAKTASLNALSADHRAKVQAIVERFDAGTLTNPRDAASQIDAVLTPDETKALLAQRQTLRDTMRATFAGNGARGGPGGRDGGSGAGERAAAPDAGRFLLSVAADPEKLRDAMRGQRERGQQ